MDKSGDDKEPAGEPKAVIDADKPADISNDKPDNPADVLDEPAKELNKINDDEGVEKTWKKMMQHQIEQGQEKMTAMSTVVTAMQETQVKLMEAVAEMTATVKQMIPPKVETRAASGQKKTPGQVEEEEEGRKEAPDQSQKSRDQWF